MPTPSKQHIIDAIIKQIRAGKDRGKVLAKIGKEWQLSQRTFDRLWKTANEQHAELQHKARDAANKAYVDAMADAAKQAVMSEQERKEVLTKIARGLIPLTKPMVVDGLLEHVPVVPSWMDRKNAIAELNSMDGAYAPSKVANTDSQGNDIKNLTDDEVNTRLALLEKASAGSKAL